MNELFLLDKKINLHNGANYSEWQTLRVVKPSMGSVEGEIPSIISVSISQRPKEDYKGISNALSFDLTQREAEDLLIALSKAITKVFRGPVQHPLVGKKVRLTEKAIKNLDLRPCMWNNVGRIESVDKDGYCELFFDDHVGRIVLIDHTSANPDFEIVEDPEAPHLKVQDIHMVLPDISGYHTVLDAAKSLVYGERVNDYGKTSENFKNICAGWEIIFKPGFTPERVGLAMAWLKICRASNDNCEKEDSIVDLAGYAACIEKIKKDL